jgi:(2R)-sulfolactate sulfo-lyase subunit alpha
MVTAQRPPDFLAHRQGDAVAVAVRDLTPGLVHGAYLDETGEVDVELLANVPLGHKLALSDVPANADVIEYGLRIGIATKDIRRGDYVHVHNVRSARWHNSVV